MGDTTIRTSRFGEIQVDASQVLTFVEPILGFEELQRYVILDHTDDSPFKWLQSADDPDLAFVVTNPKLFGIDYEFTLPEEAVQALAIDTVDDLLVLTIVNIPQSNPAEMTTNLLGPLLINHEQKKALQLVLNDSSFSTKTRLIPDDVLKVKTSASPTTQKGQ